MPGFFARGIELTAGVLMPAFLLFTGVCFAVRCRAFWILHPIRFCRTLRESTGGKTSSFRALTVALAGTLGVGNIAGVATAITAGGAGAVFWMWAGALVAMSVKYAESSLAVRYRQTGKASESERQRQTEQPSAGERHQQTEQSSAGERQRQPEQSSAGERHRQTEQSSAGERQRQPEQPSESERHRQTEQSSAGERHRQTEQSSAGERHRQTGKASADERQRQTEQPSAGERHFGGMMYVIRDGLGKKIGRRPALILGGVFAGLCLLNSLLTGTVVQVNAAASVYESVPPLLTGAVFAVLALIVNLGGGKRLSAVTGVLIPVLSAAYLVLSAFIIIRHIGAVPGVFARIIREAFSTEAIGGGLLGTVMAQSIRYGVTRGIFSNEAGCGTSPTAHAAADAKSAHHQGCYGIFEVFIDTIVLCTATALVILLAGEEGAGLDGIPLSMASYGALAGAAARQIIGISVILFAFATVICQHYYGEIAIGYFTRSRVPVRVYTLLMSAACIVGAVVSPTRVWLAADAIISLMVIVNLACLWELRKGCFCKSTP